MMEIRRATYGAAIRLAATFSLVAAVVALAVQAIGDVSTYGLVAVVAVVGFIMSWVQTGRVQRAVVRGPEHRVTVMSTRQPIA